MSYGVNVDAIEEPENHVEVLICFVGPMDDIKIFTAMLQNLGGFSKLVVVDVMLDGFATEEAKVPSVKGTPAYARGVRAAAARPAIPESLQPVL